MAKTPLKKTAAREVKKTAAKKNPKEKRSPVKKVGRHPIKAAVSRKKALTDKEREQRAANLIANTEKRKKVGAKQKRTVSVKTHGLLDAVIEGMKEKKARNMMIMDLQNVENRVTDYFVVCDADSRTHVNSIADGVEELVEKKAGERPYHAEGRQNGEWILLDYIDVVAHVFLRETRDHFNLEGLWGDAKITLINE